MRKYDKFYWLTDESRTFLSRGYLSEDETAESRIRHIADTAEKYLGIEGFSDKFYDYMSRGWYSLATPIWTNFGKERGEPISCFGSSISDNIGSILYTQGEIGMMSKLGGGTAAYFGNLRPRGSAITDNGTSTGVVHFLELFQATTNVISQGSARRGRTAAYLPIDHGDIQEFLDVGSDGHPIQDMTTAVVVDDYWMKEMIEGDSSKRSTWGKLLQSRKERGYPYLMFRDTANNKAPDVFKDKQLTINTSQLCNEIFLYNNEHESFTCILSSMNLLHYDEWKDTDEVETMVYFLDAVASEFLHKLEHYRDSPEEEKQLVWQYMKRAHKFTSKNRALGLGVLGYSSYLQSKMLSFESKEAAKLNLEIFKTINLKGNKASKELAKLFGEPENLVEYGRRNATLFAVAPTTSSAFILGQVSQSIEPPFSNCYIKDLAKVKTVIKNKYLEELLESKGHNTAEVWDIIINNDGSVLGLPDTILTAEEKAVFLTFGEINQEVVIDQASVRQDYIDQGQSINLMIPANYTAKDINALHIRAWQLGLKGLYYQHGTNAAQALLRSKNVECVACSA
jgi:ribonucleoside-diphosphate reductase alpha chain